MSSAGIFREPPMDYGYWAPLETATPVFFAPPEYMGFYIPTPAPVLESPETMGPFGFDGVTSATHLQDILRLPTSFPWTPGPTLPCDDFAYGAVYGYAAQPVPLWIKTGFFYATTPQYMYVPQIALEPFVPANDMMAYGNPMWHPAPPARRRGGHSRRGNGRQAPPGTRRNREPPAARPQPTRAAAAEAPPQQQPAGNSEARKTSSDVPEEPEPDADLADHLLAKKKVAEANLNTPSTTIPSGGAGKASAGQKAHRVYSAATLKSLNVRGPVHPSHAEGRPTASEPRIEYAWPENDVTTPGEEVPVVAVRSRRPKASVAKAGVLPPRAKSSMQEGPRSGSQRERGPRRRNSVTAW
ncbi:hypothetical protein V5799_031525 [Amblyomma americanum]|uniref:Uncharacterized protein n=1 Tax=Amblyomma americanum TaxID=6943 RepID=A0AAQ4EKH2_AMBAM